MRRRAAFAVAAGVLVAACAGSSSSAPSDTSPNVDTTVAPNPTTSSTASSTTTSTASSTTTTTTTATVPARPPALGLGDPLFPELGSSDLDVAAYDVRLDVPAGDGRVAGSVTLTIAIAPGVETLALDATGIDVEAVTIDGDPAPFEMVDPELLIELPAHRNRSVTAEVTYGFEPEPDRSAVGLPIGWIPGTERSYVLNEPDGARTWLPSNDHPSDKATWRFEITVPDDRIAVANGALEGTGGDGRPWVWVQDEPMATYLVQAIVGDYEIVDGGSFTSLDGDDIALTHVVPSGEQATFAPAMDGVAAQLAFFERLFGPYPLDRYGLAFVEDLRNLAMETQGRSMLPARDFEYRTGDALGSSPQLLLSHELAHQWFGNAVGPADWGDIWLNESFATYAHWLWLDHVGLQPLDEHASAMLRQRQTGSGSTGDPTLTDMFGFNRYDGGAVVVHALRSTLGDDAFFELLTAWVSDRTGTAQSTEAFMRAAGRAHDDDLTGFFDTWLFSDTLPDRYP